MGNKDNAKRKALDRELNKYSQLELAYNEFKNPVSQNQEQPTQSQQGQQGTS